MGKSISSKLPRVVKAPIKWVMSWPCMNPRSGWVTFANITLMAFPLLMAVYKHFSNEIYAWFQTRVEFLNFCLVIVYFIMGSAAFIRFMSFLRERHSEYSSRASTEIVSMFKDCAHSQYDLRKVFKSGDVQALGRLEDRANLVISSLRKHMENTITKVSTAEKEINITVYLAKGLLNKSYLAGQFEGILQNLTAIDKERFAVNSREINIFSDEHADYECAKCIREKRSNVIQLDPSKYKKTSNIRSEDVENYFGMMLMDKDHMILGFLNVEIHKVSCFDSEKTAREYLLGEMLPFKYALEYHILAEKLKKEAA